MSNIITDALQFAAAQTKSATQAQTSGTTPTTTPSKTSVDKDTFLNLLVAQLKNQDPLAPQDGAQFVAQLAQFNSLDQLMSINQQLGQLVDKK